MSTQEHEQDTEDRQLWEPLSPEMVQAVLARYIARRPRVLRRTISLQLHKPSWRKVQNLLWARKHFNNLIHEMLETLREDPKQPRDDGAFECIREMMIRRHNAEKQGKSPGKRTQVLAEVIAERFRQPKKKSTQDVQEAPTVDASDDDKPNPRRRPALRILKEQDYPIIHTLRPGTQRRCALMLLNFSIQSQKEPPTKKPEDSDKEEGADDAQQDLNVELARGNRDVEADDTSIDDEIEAMLDAADEASDTQTIPTVEEMHQTWAKRWERYEAAARTPIPRGRHRGKPFGEALATRRIRTGQQRGKLVRKPGKRRVRWLKENTWPLKQVMTCLEAVEILLQREMYGDKSEEVLTAETVEHLWKYQSHTFRGPRARPDTRYQVSRTRQRAALGSLSDEELFTFRDELYELMDHARQYEQIAEAVEIFLDKAPPSYPTIEPGLFDDRDEQQEYDSSLNWFHRPVTRAAAMNTDDHDTRLKASPSVAEHLHRAEYEAVTRLLQAESSLGERALQPLVYTRTMRPPDPVPSWALLYQRHQPSKQELEQRYRKLPRPLRQKKIAEVQGRNDGYVYTFVLALVVHHTRYAFTGDHPADYFAPNIREGEYSYVNFPHTPFVPPKGHSLMVFPLECGDDYHETLLHRLIERMLADQHRRYTAQFADSDPQPADPLPLEACLPRQAALGEATIIAHENGDHHFTFFLQCAVPVVAAACQTIPETILGLHQHQDGYSWALLDREGNMLKVGDLAIPWHVKPLPGKTTYHDNYAFEVAKQIVLLAHRHHALIGIEQTWGNNEVSTDARRNRQAHAHPSKKIYDQVVSKALEMGLPRPRYIFGVSRWRCGMCGNRRDNQRSKEIVRGCPVCGSLHRTSSLQFPFAPIPVPDDSADSTVWFLLQREPPDYHRARAMTDFLSWVFHQHPDTGSLDENRQQTCIAGLELVQWKGRPVFRAETGRRHDARNRKQARAKGAQPPAFIPRNLATDVVIVGPERLAAQFEAWIRAYELLAPSVLVSYEREPRPSALQHLFEHTADVAVLEVPADDSELAVGSASHDIWFCHDCGHRWNAEQEWLRCTYPSCQHIHLARFQTAMVVARLVLPQLIAADQKKNQNTSTTDTTAEDTELA